MKTFITLNTLTLSSLAGIVAFFLSLPFTASLSILGAVIIAMLVIAALVCAPIVLAGLGLTVLLGGGGLLAGGGILALAGSFLLYLLFGKGILPG